MKFQKTTKTKQNAKQPQQPNNKQKSLHTIYPTSNPSKNNKCQSKTTSPPKQSTTEKQQ